MFEGVLDLDRLHPVQDRDVLTRQMFAKRTVELDDPCPRCAWRILYLEAASSAAFSASRAPASML